MEIDEKEEKKQCPWIYWERFIYPGDGDEEEMQLSKEKMDFIEKKLSIRMDNGGIILTSHNSVLQGGWDEG